MRSERARLYKALKKAVPELGQRQFNHLIFCWRKGGRKRIDLLFSNWELDNLLAICILKVLKASTIKPGSDPCIAQEEDKDEFLGIFAQPEKRL